MVQVVLSFTGEVNMKDMKSLIDNLFVMHTDGEVPENLKDLYEKDLYSEAALPILEEILVAAGFFPEED